MLPRLKVSSFVYKCVFYRPEHNAKELNFEGFEIQKLHIPTDKAQKVDEKMGSFV